jgi:hypothetical protein
MPNMKSSATVTAADSSKATQPIREKEKHDAASLLSTRPQGRRLLPA